MSGNSQCGPTVSEHLFLVSSAVSAGHSASRALEGLPGDRLRSAAEVRAALMRQQKGALWIAPDAQAIRVILDALPARPVGDQRLLCLRAKRGDGHALLHATFRFVVSADEGACLAPIAELREILGSERRAELIAAITVSEGAVVLYRGNLEPLIVPLRWFPTHTRAPGRDASALAVIDFGQTIRMGDYEIATDAILYEFDEAYRRQVKSRRLQADLSFGGALRRLRLQKGLRQGDFPGLTAKEIARIERGEVKKPRQRTLAAIAKCLGVSVEEISTY